VELPLVISPHGRGLTGRTNATAWGDLPARGNFAVVNPDGQGRKLDRFSWGYAGQVEDLARMPEVVHEALPWLKVDRTRIYAFGGSMGGQETLLLVARHPRLLAGAAVFDSVADFALQYRSFPRLRCDGACRKAWHGAYGRGLQRLARKEIGGSPRTAPFAFARRSPITYAARIARSCVPLQIWWSVADRIVVDQQRQSRRLVRDLRRLNPLAPVTEFAGYWVHSYEMQSTTRLPLALQTFDLIPPDPLVHAGGIHVTTAPPESAWCSSETAADESR
jgi:pimeloyl-ACP methyl ester carboxylesterase